MEKYSIGGTEVKLEAFEAVTDIAQNRTLLAEKLTDAPPARPEIVEGLTTLDQVFEHFQPKVDIEFETAEGSTRRETLQFHGLADFGADGITAQSRFLSDLALQKKQYQKIAKKLKGNRQLQMALAKPETKAALIATLQALVYELQETK